LGLPLETANVYIGDNLPLGFLARDASPFMFIAGFLAAIAPAIAVGIAGISLIIRRNIFTSIVWQSLLGIFIVGLFGAMYTGISYAKNFSRSANIQQSSNLDFGKKTPLFTIKHISDHVEFVPSLEIIGYEETPTNLKRSIMQRVLIKKMQKEMLQKFYIPTRKSILYCPSTKNMSLPKMLVSVLSVFV
jgi:hypothetical protein